MGRELCSLLWYPLLIPSKNFSCYWGEYSYRRQENCFTSNHFHFHVYPFHIVAWGSRFDPTAGSGGVSQGEVRWADGSPPPRRRGIFKIFLIFLMKNWKLSLFFNLFLTSNFALFLSFCEYFLIFFENFPTTNKESKNIEHTWFLLCFVRLGQKGHCWEMCQFFIIFFVGRGVEQPNPLSVRLRKYACVVDKYIYTRFRIYYVCLRTAHLGWAHTARENRKMWRVMWTVCASKSYLWTCLLAIFLLMFAHFHIFFFLPFSYSFSDAYSICLFVFICYPYFPSIDGPLFGWFIWSLWAVFAVWSLAIAGAFNRFQLRHGFSTC